MNQQDRIALNVLIVARPEPTIDWTQISLQEQNYVIIGRVDSVAQAWKVMADTQVDIILADSAAEGVLEVDWIRRLVARSAGTLVLVVGASTEMDFIREAMLSGAKGFLLKPFDLPELSRSIEQVYQVWLQSHAQQATEPAGMLSTPASSAHTIALFSPKGGTGATMLAVNLAVGIKEQSDAPVLLVDADLHTADIDIFLSIFSKHSIIDLLDLNQPVDRDLLDSVVTDHGSGVTVLRGDSRLQFVDVPFEPGRIGELIADLKSVWDGYIVLNTKSGLDRWTAEVLDVADTVLVVTTPQLPALRVTRNFLELAEAEDNENGKWKVVMNAYQNSKALNTADIEKSIHFPIAATIAEDALLVPTSINRGMPLVSNSRKSQIAQDIAAFSKMLTSSTPQPARIDAATNPEFGRTEAATKAAGGKRFAFWRALTNAVNLLIH